MTARKRLLPLLLAGLLVSSCATVTESGRTRFAVPKQLSDAYSEVELRAMLAVTPDSACVGSDCEAAAAFRLQVAQLGGRLAKAARELGPGLGYEVPEFALLVPGANEVGTFSSATGSIVVFDGTRSLELDDTALAFVLAREMGHVLANHHDENSATQIIISVVVTLALPVLNLLRGAAATLSTATTLTATTAATTAASTVASMAGVRIVKSIYRPDQLREADTLALKLMVQAGWSTAEVADSLHQASRRLSDEGWSGEMLASKSRLDSLTAGPPWLLPSALAEAKLTTIGPALD